jgi:hypothetical protein
MGQLPTAEAIDSLPGFDKPLPKACSQKMFPASQCKSQIVSKKEDAQLVEVEG